jgi:hypothetical protein
MGTAVNKLAAKMLVVRFATVHVVVPPHIRVREGKRQDVDGYEYDRDVKTGREVPGSRQPLPKQGALGKVKAKLGLGPKEPERPDTAQAAMADFASKNEGWKVTGNGRVTNGDVTITNYPTTKGDPFEVTYHEDNRKYRFGSFQEAIESVAPKGSDDDDDRKWWAHQREQTRDRNEGLMDRDLEGNPLFRRDSTGKAVRTEHHPAEKERMAKEQAEYKKRRDYVPPSEEFGQEVAKFGDIFEKKDNFAEKSPGLTDEQLASIKEAAEDARNGDFEAALKKLEAINTSPEMRKLSDFAFDSGYRTKAEKGRESSRSKGNRRQLAGALGGPNGWSDWLNFVRTAVRVKNEKTKPGGSK